MAKTPEQMVDALIKIVSGIEPAVAECRAARAKQTPEQLVDALIKAARIVALRGDHETGSFADTARWERAEKRLKAARRAVLRALASIPASLPT